LNIPKNRKVDRGLRFVGALDKAPKNIRVESRQEAAFNRAAMNFILATFALCSSSGVLYALFIFEPIATNLAPTSMLLCYSATAFAIGALLFHRCVNAWREHALCVNKLRHRDEALERRLRLH